MVYKPEFAYERRRIPDMEKVKTWRKMLVAVLAAGIISLGSTGCKQEAEHPTNEHPTSEHPTDDAAAKKAATEEAATEEAPAKEHPAGEHPAGEHPK
jgi:hypothetical protein